MAKGSSLYLAWFFYQVVNRVAPGTGVSSVIMLRITSFVVFFCFWLFLTCFAFSLFGLCTSIMWDTVFCFCCFCGWICWFVFVFVFFFCYKPQLGELNKDTRIVKKKQNKPPTPESRRKAFWRHPWSASCLKLSLRLSPSARSMNGGAWNGLRGGSSLLRDEMSGDWNPCGINTSSGDCNHCRQHWEYGAGFSHQYYKKHKSQTWIVTHVKTTLHSRNNLKQI